MGILAVGLGGCASELSTPELDEATSFILMNDLDFDCQDHQHVISYIENHHVQHEQVNTVSRFKEAAKKIAGQKKLPTPYFTTAGDLSLFKSVFDYIIHDVDLKELLDADKKNIRWLADQVKSKEDICQAVQGISDVIWSRMTKENWEVKPYIDALVHKSILRFFVESLDPHSKFQEFLEWRFRSEGRKESVTAQNEPEQGDSQPISSSYDEARQILTIEIYKFEKCTRDKFKSIYLEHYNQHPLKGLVIDLRRSPGGEAYVVSDLADLFMDKGITLLFERRNLQGSSKDPRYAVSGNELPGLESLPVTLLISQRSASSAETFAAAMKVNQKALIVGKTSFGKGTGQGQYFLYELPDSFRVKASAVLKLTEFYLYQPNGMPIQRVGIHPDMVVTDPVFGLYSLSEERLQGLPAPPPFDVAEIESFSLDEPKFSKWDQFRSHLSSHFHDHGDIFSLDQLATAIESFHLGD